MYCVKCGVKLQDGVSRCPLCGTPVWDPDSLQAEHSYPDTLPRHSREPGRPLAVSMTLICVIAAAVILTVCFRLYGQLRWGGCALGGILLFYIVFILPAWFRHPHGEVFLPVDFLAAGLLALYICLRTGGHWFMRFAFPVLGMACILCEALLCLLKYVRRGRLWIFGGFLLLSGGFCVLTELFQHICFGSPMFRWSLYALIGFGAAGMFLLLAGMIRPMRQALEKRFFF